MFGFHMATIFIGLCKWFQNLGTILHNVTEKWCLKHQIFGCHLKIVCRRDLTLS